MLRYLRAINTGAFTYGDHTDAFNKLLWFTRKNVLFLEMFSLNKKNASFLQSFYRKLYVTKIFFSKALFSFYISKQVFIRNILLRASSFKLGTIALFLWKFIQNYLKKSMHITVKTVKFRLTMTFCWTFIFFLYLLWLVEINLNNGGDDSCRIQQFMYRSNKD